MGLGILLIPLASAALYIYYWLYDSKPYITISTKAIQINHFTSNIIAACPSFHKRFIPSFWFVNGNLQTVAASVLRRTPDIEFEREELFMKDGGLVTLDWISLNVGNNQDFIPHEHHDKEQGEDIIRSSSQNTSANLADSTVPTLIVLHGLTGGSNESYVRHIIREAQEHHLNCVAFNYRGAAGVSLRTPIGYSAGQTDDLRAVLAHIRKKLRNSPLFAVGFSLGANILVKYLGEDGEKVPLAGAVAISNPWKLKISAEALQSGFIQRIINRQLGSNLKNFLKRHYDVVKGSTVMDLDSVFSSRSKTVQDFDEYVTRRAFGFKSVDDYYNASSSASFLHNVKIPLLAINALDDPIAPPAAVPFEEVKTNPNIILLTTKRGGHVAWLQGLNVLHLKNSWMDTVSLEFISAVSKQNVKEK